MVQGRAKLERSILMVRDLEVEPEKIHRGGCDPEVRNRGGAAGCRQRMVAREDPIGGHAAILALHAQAGRRVALRVEIHDQDLLAHGRERGPQIDGRGGLADPAFLIGQDEDSGRLVTHVAPTLSVLKLQALWRALPRCV